MCGLIYVAKDLIRQRKKYYLNFVFFLEKLGWKI